MKGASFARQGEASDLELVPTWVAVWVGIFEPHCKTTFYNKKSPKTEVFEDFWSCWADLNRRPHPYQAAPELFSNYFLRFMAISAPIRLLSVTLRMHCLHILRTALWLKMWSKTLPALCQKYFPDWGKESFLVNARK